MDGDGYRGKDTVHVPIHPGPQSHLSPAVLIVLNATHPSLRTFFSYPESEVGPGWPLTVKTSHDGVV